jgi:hypothetical protein
MVNRQFLNKIIYILILLWFGLSTGPAAAQERHLIDSLNLDTAHNEVTDFDNIDN